MTVEYPALSLPRYAQRIGYRDCAFFGVQHDDNPSYACREIWTQWQRDEIAFSLLQAQSQIEAVLGYPLSRRWFGPERHNAKPLIKTAQGYVVAPGVLSDTVLAASAAVSYVSDPATVTVAGVTCDVDDVHVFHVDTDTEITPSSRSLAGGLLTLSIPWCRLVAPAYSDNPAEGWRYADVATWGASHVDVRCLRNDTTVQGRLSRPACAGACEEETATACLRVRDGRLGLLAVQRARYVAGSGWLITTDDCCRWDSLDVFYYAGVATPSRLAEDAIIRLAHANMPTEPCGCDVTQRLWRRDRNVPEVLDRERLNCPFGMSDGAWIAWRFANSERLVRGSMWA